MIPMMVFLTILEAIVCCAYGYVRRTAALRKFFGLFIPFEMSYLARLQQLVACSVALDIDHCPVLGIISKLHTIDFLE